MAHEWARTRRRRAAGGAGKLGLSIGATDKAALAQFMAAHGAATAGRPPEKGEARG